MAFQSKDGKSFTNKPPMMAHDRSMARQSGGGMEQQRDPLAQPGDEMGGGDEPQMGDKPMMTEHHEDGSHTTHHESGAVKHHATAEELVQHLAKHMPEEEHEIEMDSEPEYE